MASPTAPLASSQATVSTPDSVPAAARYVPKQANDMRRVGRSLVDQ